MFVKTVAQTIVKIFQSAENYRRKSLAFFIFKMAVLLRSQISKKNISNLFLAYLFLFMLQHPLKHAYIIDVVNPSAVDFQQVSQKFRFSILSRRCDRVPSRCRRRSVHSWRQQPGQWTVDGRLRRRHVPSDDVVVRFARLTADKVRVGRPMGVVRVAVVRGGLDRGGRRAEPRTVRFVVLVQFRFVVGNGSPFHFRYGRTPQFRGLTFEG